MVDLDTEAIAYCDECKKEVETTFRKLKNKWIICKKCELPMKGKVKKDAVSSVHTTD